MRKSLFLSMVLVFLLPLALYAQKGSITGKVTNAKTGEALVGANIVIQGTALGAATGINGNFVIRNVPIGTYTLGVTFIGYDEASAQVQVTSGAITTVNIELQEQIISGATITVLADRAKPRETPVAFTDVRKQDMQARLGSQDIPLVLNTTPSVYSTMQGGGAGDARLNIRGFNQNNVAVMINGVPINDMENGWVYWSNWDGVGDAASSIQIQRGLSAINLATPSIGGTMNIITDPTALQSGVNLKQEVGNDGFLKSTLIANSGLIDGKYAFTGGIVRKTGDGLYDKTWTDAWAYYFGGSWQINPSNRLELYAIGAPQRHGQNSYMQNIGAYSHDFAKDLDDYDPLALDKFKESASGRKYNENWGPVNSSYTGKQFWNGKERDRYDPNFINERENYYHKPIVNLNWYSMLTEKLGLFSTVYYSGGTGGGSGTFGSMVWDRTGPSQVVDWIKTIARNDTSSKGSLGILRNSVNNQWTIGAISKASYKLTDAVNLTGGVDWRTAEIEHFREVRDLLGGDYYFSNRNQFNSPTDYNKGLGGKIDYNFTNTVDWIGFFGQSEYSSGPISAYGMGGYSMIKYSYTNHFIKNDAGSELTAETDWIKGFQVKGGASYRFTDNLDVFANAGYVSKVPIFDDVIDDRTATQAVDPKNEKFTSIEGGTNYSGFNGKLAAKANFYVTTWKDKSITRSVELADGSEGIIFIQGLDVFHTGVEFEAAYQPISLLRLDGAVSVGNWTYTDDVTGTYKDYSKGPGQEQVTETYYLKDLKSGNAPQTQFALVGSLYPIRGLMAQGVFRYYANHYANWEPTSRTNPDDRAESWKAPNYGVLDFHASYNLPVKLGPLGLQLFAHVFNALDAIYVQDATDNSAYNAFAPKQHKADDAEVYLGLPRTFNIGLQISY